MRIWILLGIAVIAVVGFVALPGDGAAGDDPRATAPADRALPAAVDVKPVLMRGTISGASWRDGDEAEAPVAAAPEEAPRDPFGDLARERELERRQRRSLEETLDGNRGLGIYVAPPSEDDDGSGEDR